MMRAKAITLSGLESSIKTYLNSFRQQIVLSQEIPSFPHLPPLLSECFGRLKDLLDSTRDDPPHILQLAPFHSKGLPAASLAISKAANIVSIQSRLHQKGNLFENLTLRGTWPKHTVKAEVIALLCVSRATCVRLGKRSENWRGFVTYFYLGVLNSEVHFPAEFCSILDQTYLPLTF